MNESLATIPEPIIMKSINTYDLGDARSILNYKNKESAKRINNSYKDVIKKSAFEVIDPSRKSKLLQCIDKVKPVDFQTDYVYQKPRKDPKISKWESMSRLENLAGYDRKKYGCSFGETSNNSSLSLKYYAMKRSKRGNLQKVDQTKEQEAKSNYT